jgi:DNA-binding MarR family transcriptional regulator
MAHYWPDADQNAFVAVGSLLRAQRIVRRRLENIGAVRAYGLSFTRLEILGLLYYNQEQPLPMTAIGSWLVLHPGSVTSAVDQLVKQGYARRIRPEEDRRTVLAELTDEGRAAVEACMPQIAVDRFGLSGLTDTEVNTLVQLLFKVRAEADPV